MTNLINKAVDHFGLDEALVRGIIQVESRGKLSAVRWEKTYPYLWNVRTKEPIRHHVVIPPENFPSIGICSGETECALQRMSWGGMQVMGAVARELGFGGEFLSELIESPYLALFYGCKHLKNLSRRYSNDDLIAAYNAGTPRKVGGKYENQGYVDKVKAEMSKWQLK